MIDARTTVTGFALATLLGATSALAQVSSEPANSNNTDSMTSSKPADPDAPSSNSVDGTGTFSVNPPVATDSGLGGVKTGPSRTDMNTEIDPAATAASSPPRPDSKADLNASDTGQLPASPR